MNANSRLRRSALFLGAALATVIAGAMNAKAIAQPTIVKPGMWEITSTTRISEIRTSGNPVAGPTGQSDQLPEEARKPVLAPDVTTTQRKCLTAPAARSWSALFGIGGDFSACEVKPGLRNDKRYTATLRCAGGKAGGKATFNATATSFNGEVSVTAHEPSYDRLDTKIVAGRWLRSSCDDDTQVKPRP